MQFFPPLKLFRRGSYDAFAALGGGAHAVRGQGWGAAALGSQRQEKGRSRDGKPHGRTGEQGQGCSPRRRAGRARSVTPVAGWGSHQPQPATSVLVSTLALPVVMAEGCAEAGFAGLRRGLTAGDAQGRP